MTDDRCRGTVTEYDAAKGYGRIQDEQNQSFYVHFRDIIAEDALKVGQAVEFRPVLHRKGNLAQEVHILC